MSKQEYEDTHIRLKTARRAAGFKTARNFCDKFGIPHSTYSLHETGNRNIKPAVAKKYAELLGVNSVWLLTGTGTPFNLTLPSNSTPISAEEFQEMLKYEGNPTIQNSFDKKTFILSNVNTVLFSKIILEISLVLNTVNIDFDINQLSLKASEMYTDIVSSTNKLEEQLAMVNLSITIFKRQLQEVLKQSQSTANAS